MESTDSDIAQALRTEIEAAGISQAQLAKAVGVSPSTVSMYLSGRRRPSIATLTALANAMDIPPYRLLGNSDDADIDAAVRTVIDRMDDLSSAQRVMVAEALLGSGGLLGEN